MGHWFKRSKPHFESLGPSARISYSTWFLKNRCVFDRKNETQKQREDAFNRAAYLYGGDPALSPHEIRRELISRSKNKVACFNMCARMLYQFHPSPLDNIWVPFGFCTCDENTELGLGGMYEGLFWECTFQELYDAHEASQLVGLSIPKDGSTIF